MATISEPPGGAVSNRPPAGPAPTAVRGWVPANPAPLGLAGFGLTTFVLSMVNSGLVSANDLPVVFGLAIAYGGIAQLLAGIWEFRTGNTFGAVAFTSYGAFWISFYFLVTGQLGDLVKTNTLPSAGGLYLWAWGIFTGYMFLCSFASARSVSLVFLLLTATFIVLGIGWSGTTTAGIAGATTTTIHIGGFLGLATAAAALYTSCGEVMFAQYGRWVLPIGAPKPRA